MKKNAIIYLILVFLGFVLGILLVNLVTSRGMMIESESRYDFETTLNTIEQSATAAGWTVPIVHDLQKSLAKAGKEVNQVKVFALCNPEYAVGILTGDEERIFSNMMPCRVSVYMKSDGKTYISRVNIPKISRGMPQPARSAMRGAYRDMEKILSGIVN
jgi:uncharacterized protein (DUF302 family)